MFTTRKYYVQSDCFRIGASFGSYCARGRSSLRSRFIAASARLHEWAAPARKDGNDVNPVEFEVHPRRAGKLMFHLFYLLSLSDSPLTGNAHSRSSQARRLFTACRLP